ncbi:dermonecrotic toxin domain-containing protein [Pseudomonas sp. NPDC089752]|uniref:dermonecrotic toxin domain-containing protein n=1 Tax=Pseudomonas sp. NPDC089752 TaxID=3364472 RepID=UPI0038068649
MPNPDTSTFDFKSAAAVHFSDRPTLRQVASKHLLEVLLEELPWLAAVEPALGSADPLMLDSPVPGADHWTTEPLVDHLLSALLSSRPLDVEPVEGRHHNLGLSGAYRFAGSHSEFDTRQTSGLSGPLNDLLGRLATLFGEAQVEYWGKLGAAGVSRDVWLQWLLKAALAFRLPAQGLDAHQQACLRGLLRGGSEQPQVYLVEAHLGSANETLVETQVGVLVGGEWDEQRVLLWCEPTGDVRAFDSLQAFALGLRNELAQRYAFDSMSWSRYPIQGNVFAQYAALLLETQLERIERLRYSPIADLAQLEHVFAQLSDPGQWFAGFIADTARVPPPPGLVAGPGRNSFAYCEALLQLGIDQMEADGIASLDGIQNLNDYTRQRLAELMRQKHGYQDSVDDLVLELGLARGIPGGAATGSGGGEPLEPGHKTLIEFAIGNLSALHGAAILRIRHQDGRDGPYWLNADTVRALVSEADIGGRYPRYVADALDAPDKRPDRLKRFAREWRSAMVFSALQAQVDGKLTEAGLQCVVDFCAGRMDPLTPRASMMPLAFKRQPQSQQIDRVRCMYVLYCAEPELVLLYRPLYQQDAIRQYASLAALLEHIGESALLQDSIVQWLEPRVRHIYANGGFKEPHVASIGIDPFETLERPAPPVLVTQFWFADLDEALYSANRDLLVELADLHSTSDAESYWASLAEFAWLLFDTVTVILKGPVASAAWLLQLLSSLESDMAVMEQEQGVTRSAAVANLLLNLGMALLHVRQPRPLGGPGPHSPLVARFEGLAEQRGAFAEVAITPDAGSLHASGAFASGPDRRLDFAWRASQGFNWLPAPQRAALRAMRSSLSLHGLAPLSSGDNQGLYRVDGHYYAALAGDSYRVEKVPGGARVVSDSGAQGPWLAYEHGEWRIDSALRLRAGMPRETLARRLKSKYDSMFQLSNVLSEQARASAALYNAVIDQKFDTNNKFDNYYKLQAAAQGRIDSRAPTAENQKANEDDQRVISLCEEKIEGLRVIAKKLDNQSAEILEKSVGLDKQLFTLLNTLLEDKYNSYRSDGHLQSLEAMKVISLVSMIRSTDIMLIQLTELVDYPRLDRLRAKIVGKRVGTVEEAYAEYRQGLEHVVAYQERMLLGEEYFDQLLTDAPGDLVVEGAVAGQGPTVDQIIGLRTYSTVQLRVHHVMNLADLALHMNSLEGHERIAEFRENLAGKSLLAAAGAHGELSFANVSLDDRISILQEAWDEYAAALVNSATINSTGGALIDALWLQRYREHVERLKLDAGQRLVKAIEAQESANPPPQRQPYRPTVQRQQVLHTAEGLIVIATNVQESGQEILQVLDPISKEVRSVYELRDNIWQERPDPSAATAPPDDEVVTDTAMRVQALVDKSDEVLAKADDYIKNKLRSQKVVRLFDRHIDKLRRAIDMQGKESLPDALVRRLEEELDKLRSQKELKLIKLYTDTPYPFADGLKFLHDKGLIKAEYMFPRNTMADGSAFDEYKIIRLANPGDQKGRPLWAAHFHMPSADTVSRGFTVGHLKTWAQRRRSGREEEGGRVHRGRLTLEQAEGIIPF